MRNRRAGKSVAGALFAKALAKRLEGSGKTANAVHPGVIATNLGRHMSLVARAAFPIASAVAMKNVHEGSATQCYVATHPSLADVNGEFFADCRARRIDRVAACLADGFEVVASKVQNGVDERARVVLDEMQFDVHRASRAVGCSSCARDGAMSRAGSRCVGKGGGRRGVRRRGWP